MCDGVQGGSLCISFESRKLFCLGIPRPQALQAICPKLNTCPLGEEYQKGQLELFSSPTSSGRWGFRSEDCSWGGGSLPSSLHYPKASSPAPSSLGSRQVPSPRQPQWHRRPGSDITSSPHWAPALSVFFFWQNTVCKGTLMWFSLREHNPQKQPATCIHGTPYTTQS